MAKQFRARVGFDYKDKTRYEAGDIVTDLDRTTAADLLAIDAIEPYDGKGD
jgi:hypothetical protein